MTPGQLRIGLGVAIMAALTWSVWQIWTEPRRSAPSVEGLPAAAGETSLQLRPLTSPGSELVGEQAAMFDPAPLFVPTRWNAASAALPDGTAQRARHLFDDYPPKRQFTTDRPDLGLPETVPVPAQAPAVLQAYGDLGGATALGRRDVRLDALPHRAAYYEIVDERTGRVLRKGAVPQGGWPDAGDWRPMELMAAVGPAGLVRSPSLVEGSGVDAVDAFALDYLVRGLRVGALMPPGFYRIRLGP